MRNMGYVNHALLKDREDEQAGRIKENVRDAEEAGGFRSYAEFEAAFEDRDPCEFL